MRNFVWAAMMLIATMQSAGAVERVLLEPTDRGLESVELFVETPEGDGPSPVILFVHGYQWEQRPGGRAFVEIIGERPEIATIDEGRVQELARRGYIAASVSQPGFGDSAGPSDFCGPRTQEAVMAAFDYLLSLPNADKTRVALYGVSRGAATASMVATKDPRITALILMAGVYDLEEFYPTGDKYLDLNILNETGATPEAFAERAALRYADRIGCEVRHDGRWVHLTGNDIGALVAYQAVRRAPAGRRPLVVKTELALARGCFSTISRASSMEGTDMRQSTGPKISSWAITMSVVTPSKRVGPTK